jgi:hypothetical protein
MTLKTSSFAGRPGWSARGLREEGELANIRYCREDACFCLPDWAHAFSPPAASRAAITPYWARQPFV